MSTSLKTIASKAINTYKKIAPANTFFGINLANVDLDALKESLAISLYSSPLGNFQEFIEDEETVRKELSKKFDEANESIATREAKFTAELIEAKAAFDHELTLKNLAFEREVELKAMAMDHNERVFVEDSKFTKEFITSELANAKMVHEAELKNQALAFENEVAAAKASADAAIAHAKAISDAAIAKAKSESEILYTYDVSVLAKKVQSEVSDRYDALIAIANKYEAAQELIARLEADKAYFQNFSAERVERSEDVTDALIEKISKSECKPVTVNVTEIKKSKKSND